MALASIQVEQFSADKWTGEVEVGGLVSRRKVVRAASFDELLAALSAAYRGMVPAPKLPDKPEEIPSPAVVAPAQRQSRDELIERARLAGVDVDGRWSDARLLYQVGLAEEAKAASER